MTDSSDLVTFADIETARERLDDESVVKRTPVERSTSLDELTGGEVHLKMEHLQWTGSFKTRGAYNKIAKTAAEGDIGGVVAASAGNHAQGVALAATKLGVESTIVMPRTAPQAKVDATREYGAEVELVGTDFREAMAHAQELSSADDDVEFVHAYDDPAIVAGQGTLGVEMYEDLPEVDTIVVPIGGGGLISGIATAFDELSPETRVVGVQASGATTVPDSLQKGVPVSLESVDTIADGIATGGISDLTLSLIEDHVDEVVTVTDGEIARAILLLLERAKQVVEGAGAASVAAIISEELDVSGETVMPLLCGGNLDMTMLQTVLVHALSDRDQLLRLRVRIDDQPGKMEEISGLIAKHNANIQTIRHDRSAPELDVGEAHLVFEIETSGAGQARAIIRSIRDHGHEVKHANA
ncbi:threonine ammonia-lyase [Natronobacterium gregoryi]|uniref:threonine ammonia-lyase n=2 Tax=Natronobacterium gregoryi TaxID=44930 RepID=L0AHC8_NATGS|nr:threonine ammonia-lyase [Natronobacterium gregoryi]AFZ72844.1 threonine dehydratase, medium form [Natronobacterium gregoryi SP2]ELY69668.1 threonine dehydratase [Natronobacterium gregoryi SP2]PLK21927.1 threonine ammonia-lyase [Natronobacterium gregoryi SP2]SFI65547.1 threonine dehydratase [Natronobacterium gregoryi]